MNTIASFYTSSVGRKLLIGLTGFFLLSFLIVHLYINLFIFKADGGHTFDTYSEFMATYPLIRPLEWILFGGFLAHVFLGVWLWLTNRGARQNRYTVNRPSENSTLSSRIMFWTGVVVFVFLVLHINTFFVWSRFLAPGEPKMIDRIFEVFQNPWTDIFYIVAILFLAYHLKHGVQSAFQTYGIRSSKYQWLITLIGVFFWLLIPLGFIAMPLYVLWTH